VRDGKSKNHHGNQWTLAQTRIVGMCAAKACKPVKLLPSGGWPEKCYIPAAMATSERRNRGDYVPGVDAEKSRAERRRNIMQAVEKRLDGLQSAALAAPSGDAKDAASRSTKRKRSARVLGVFRL